MTLKRTANRLHKIRTGRITVDDGEYLRVLATYDNLTRAAYEARADRVLA